MAYIRGDKWCAEFRTGGRRILIGYRESKELAVLAERIALHFYNRYRKLPDYGHNKVKIYLCDWTPLLGVPGIYYKVTASYDIIYMYSVRDGAKRIKEAGFFSLSDALLARKDYQNAKNSQHTTL